MLRELPAWLGLGLLSLSWFVTLFVSQVSSTNYRSLFFCILPWAVVHAVLAVNHATRVRGWRRWCIEGFAWLALCSFLELAARVWL